MISFSEKLRICETENFSLFMICNKIRENAITRREKIDIYQNIDILSKKQNIAFVPLPLHYITRTFLTVTKSHKVAKFVQIFGRDFTFHHDS